MMPNKPDYKIVSPAKPANGADSIPKNGYAKLVFQSKDGTECIERAWVLVKQVYVHEPKYIGIFFNDAVHNIGVNSGDIVEFSSYQVIATLPPNFNEADTKRAYQESLENYPRTANTLVLYDR